MAKVSKSKKSNNSGLIVGLVFLAIILAVVGFMSWNSYQNRPYDKSIYTPVQIAEKDVVPVSRDVVINAYKNNKNNFDKVINYLANNPTQFKINLKQDNGSKSVDISPAINDAEIKGMLEQMVLDYGFKSIFNTFSLSPDDMSVWFLYDGKEGSYQRGLVFFKNEAAKSNYSTRANEVWELQELATQTYFYYNHFDKVQHQDVFRNKGWEELQNDTKLTSEQKRSVITKKDQAIIKITKVKDPSTGELVDAISLTYSTSKPGYGNNIIVYLNGETREKIKVTTAGEEMFGL